MKPSTRTYNNASVDRAFRVLECFSDENASLSLAEIVRRTALTKATAFRFLAVLVRGGYVERGDDDRYHLGYRLFELGSRVKQEDAFRRRLHPLVANLVAIVSESAHLGVLHGTNVLYTDTVAAPNGVRVARTGLDLDAHATGIGKVLLAYLPEDDVRRLYRGRTLAARTSRTITNVETLIRALRHVREQRYGFDMGEFEDGLCCVAAPILDASGNAPCAISVSGPATRITDLALPQIVAAVSSVAAEASAALSGRTPERAAASSPLAVERSPRDFDPLFER